MKYLNEFIDYLKKEGYEDKYHDLFCGELLGVDCFYNNDKDKLIILRVDATEEFSNYLREKVKEKGEFEYDIDYKNYIVIGVIIKSTITSESGYADKSIGNIYLNNGIAEGNYYTHGIEYFEKCVQLQKLGLVEHEIFIMEKHLQHLKWANEVLIPILKKSDYTIDYSSIFDLNPDKRESSNLSIYFKHVHERDAEFCMETDCITGECLFPNKMQLYGKSKEEVWDMLVEEYWKKMPYEFTRKRYSYLYTEGETIDTFKEYIEELNKQIEEHEQTKLRESVLDTSK